MGIVIGLVILVVILGALFGDNRMTQDDYERDAVEYEDWERMREEKEEEQREYEEKVASWDDDDWD